MSVALTTLTGADLLDAYRAGQSSVFVSPGGVLLAEGVILYSWSSVLSRAR